MWREGETGVGGVRVGGGSGWCAFCPWSVHVKRHSSSAGWAVGVDGCSFWFHMSCKQISISVGWEEVQQDQEPDQVQDLEQEQDQGHEQDQGQE